MSDPLKDIEDKQGQIDLGKMTARIFEGALEETGSFLKAFWVTVAYCTGIFKNNQPDNDDDS